MTEINKDNGLPFISSFQVNPDLVWQMSRSEKYALIGLLEHLKPNCSVEIGTFQGGSLQVISEFSEKVYSIDISPEPKRTLQPLFDNVEFIVDQSVNVLHDLFKKIEEAGEKLNFVLVDGDHSRKGVHDDLKMILDYPHKNDLVILMHDSYNPQCRKGMKDIDYSSYDNIEYVELDYITGSFWHNGNNREMWGGLALIKVGGNQNTPAEVTESARNSFKVAQLHSIHIIKDKLRFLSPIKKRIYKQLKMRHKADKYFDFEK
ncbi:hypothetical protein OB69_02980 [Roseivirga seohaensis subsp. aquiponti]|uniref:Rhamnosyl O-methyltransferase n=1 Tax=Roseivirga seohaensis subsp. aquiponti TaxID=1566026 RepID=A0A0L8ANR6_9BACT|nr:class I SAM-dependent methyltransferase [Roseivirga seohaensis]KOF03984.1 hypothetical protein OB69_02980 [Roseivirga seohaensis subsp. aquiponti]